MVPSRSLTVLAAVALALIAGGAAYVGVHSAQRDAYNHSALTSAYVLSAVVPRDESVAAAYAQGLIASTRIPSRFVPVGAVTDLAAIRDRVAGSDLPAGEVVVRTMFVSAKVGASLAAESVPQGDVAVSVSVDEAHGVAGLIQPGDKVDILVDIDKSEEASLFHSVPVMAVGSTLVPAPGTAAPRTTAETTAAVRAHNLITLAVPPAAASLIASADGGGDDVTGGIYLALEGKHSGSSPAATITGLNLATGNPTGRIAPAGGSPPVSVVRGDQDETTP